MFPSKTFHNFLKFNFLAGPITPQGTGFLAVQSVSGITVSYCKMLITAFYGSLDKI